MACCPATSFCLGGMEKTTEIIDCKHFEGGFGIFFLKQSWPDSTAHNAGFQDIVAYGNRDTSLENRLQLWQASAIHVFLQHSLLG